MKKYEMKEKENEKIEVESRIIEIKEIGKSKARMAKIVIEKDDKSVFIDFYIDEIEKELGENLKTGDLINAVGVLKHQVVDGYNSKGEPRTYENNRLKYITSFTLLKRAEKTKISVKKA